LKKKLPETPGRKITEDKSACSTGPHPNNISDNHGILDECFNLIPGLACMLSSDGYFRKLSVFWEDTLGYSAEDLRSRPLVEFVHPDDIKLTSRKLREHFSGSQSLSLINRCRCKDGSFRWLEWNAGSHHPADVTFAVARDITEYKTTEESLRSKKKLLGSILESAGMGILVVDKTGRVQYSNSTFNSMWNISPVIRQDSDDEWVLSHLLEQVQQPVSFRNHILTLLQSSETSNLILHLKDGRVFQCISHPQVLDGNIIGRSWGFYDVTQRSRVEEALKESEEKFRSLAEHSPNMIFINIRGKVVYVNKRCTVLMGYPRDYFYSDAFDFFSITAPEFIDLVKEKFHVHLQGREVEPYEYALIKTDGKKLYTVLSTKLIKYAGEDAILGVITDITERKKAEIEVERVNNELKELNHSKDKFFSIIAHDLKNPFNTIFWFTNSLLKDLDKLSHEEVRFRLELISNSSKQAFNLVENLLLWAQSQNRSIRFQPEEIDIPSFVCESIGMVQSQADIKKIAVKCTICEEFSWVADKNMLDTILRNLLTNAIQFTPQKGEIIVSASRRKGDLEISVQDNGIGIEKEHLESIFKIGTKQNFSGTAEKNGNGLGLILCREFVERHGGTIKAQSEAGKGSVFRFTIPALQK
jgi:PAS domain S-box-containing protein